MRLFNFASATIVACLAMTGTAMAGEHDLKAGAAGHNDWSGFYIGAHAAYGWSEKDWTLLRNAGPNPSGQIGSVITSHDADGGLGGLQAGYNTRFGGVVLGAEGEFSWTGMDGYSTWQSGGQNPGRFRDASTDIDWIATLSGRVGVPMGDVLLFVKGGVAWAEESYSHTGGNPPTNPRLLKGDDTRVGWLVGVGAEWACSDDWSLKLEYDYIDFGEDKISLTDGVRTAVFDVEQDVHALKIGINFHFDSLQ